MPYIKEYLRDLMKPEVQGNSLTAGELNFQITSLVFDYYQRHDHDYQTINDIVGALEGAKLEFYRRVAVPYEDAKIKENGDVYV